MQAAEVAFQREQNELEITRAKELSAIEVSISHKYTAMIFVLCNVQVKRFRKVVDSIGSATITEIAESGPRAQVCLSVCTCGSIVCV